MHTDFCPAQSYQNNRAHLRDKVTAWTREAVFPQATSHIANLVQLSYATSIVYLCIYLFIEVDIYIYMYLRIHVHFVFHLSRIPRDEEGHICCEGCAWTCMCCYVLFLQPEEFCQLHLRAFMQGLGKHIFMYAYMLLLHTYRYVW